MRPFWQAFFEGGAPEVDDPEPPCARFFDPSLVYWVTKNIPHTEAVKHFLVCGTVGSGKTTVIQLFLQSIAPRFLGDYSAREVFTGDQRLPSARRFIVPDRSAPEQLVVFDAKGDMVVRLQAMGFDCSAGSFHILNPFDKRASTWNLSEAINTPAMARYLATLLIPEETTTTAPYFPDTAREILFWVALSLNHRRGKEGWTLRDLLNAIESKERIAGVTQHLPRASRVVQQHLDDKRHFPGVLSTLATKLGKFEEVAALWHTNKNAKPFSVKRFLGEPGVLVLPHDPVLYESIWPINAIMLQALSNEILRGRETKTPRHWFVLDEFRAMGEVRCIRDLLNLGRSKGASVLLGIQSVEGLMEKYKENATNDMLSLCSTKTFLRVGGPFTAEWAERHFNKVRHIERSVTETSGVTSSTSVTYKVEERSIFLPAMFLDLPFPVRGGAFGAITDLPFLRTTLITDRMFDELLALKTDPSEEAEAAERDGKFFREDPAEQIVKRWESKEVADFCDTLPPKNDGTKEAIPLISKQEHRRRRYGS